MLQIGRGGQRWCRHLGGRGWRRRLGGRDGCAASVAFSSSRSLAAVELSATSRLSTSFVIPLPFSVRISLRAMRCPRLVSDGHQAGARRSSPVGETESFAS